MKIRDFKILSILFSATASAYLVLSWWIWTTPLIELANRPIAPWQVPTMYQPQAWIEANEPKEFSASLSRPLFNRSRRPFKPPPLQISTPPEAIMEVPPPLIRQQPDISQVFVKGIIISTNNRKALVVTPENPEGSWVGIGVEQGGWKLTGISNTGIELSFGNQKQLINLYVDNTAN